jgi:hypothetical protein
MNYLTVTLDFALWWYSGGLKKLYLWLAALFGWLNNFFSVKRVVFTMFEPWKRVVSEKRPGLEGFRDFLIDNFISRLVGFVMRVLILMVSSIDSSANYFCNHGLCFLDIVAIYYCIFIF